MIPFLAACGSSDVGPTTTDTSPAFDCTSLSADFPEARGDHAGVFDAATGRFIFFGGDVGVPENCESRTSFSDETWAWVDDCGAWQRIAGDGPSARGRHVAALDPAGRMLVHGGRTRDGTSGTYTVRDDTWALDFATDTWTKVASSGPPPRSSHAGAVANGKLVVYGGNASDDGLAFEPLEDLWSMDLASGAWSEVGATDGPGPRLFHAGATDGERLFVYGGGDENAFFGPFFGDLWSFDPESGQWTELHDGETGKAPRARIQANLAYDAATNRVILFGGHDDGAMGNNNELWAFDLATEKWDLIRQGDVENAPANGFCDFPVDFTEIDFDAPERRSQAAAALDPAGRLYVSGGKSDCGALDDVWAWTGAAWDKRIDATSGLSCPRAYADCESLCF